MGIARANMAAVAISPRNAPDAIAHLLLKVRATALFVSSEVSLQNNARRALDLISKSPENPSSVTLEMHPMLVFEDMYPIHPVDELEYIPAIDYDLDSEAFIFHSSGIYFRRVFFYGHVTEIIIGTTAYPKPVAWRYRDTMLWYRMPCKKSPDLLNDNPHINLSRVWRYRPCGRENWSSWASSLTSDGEHCLLLRGECTHNLNPMRSSFYFSRHLRVLQ